MSAYAYIQLSRAKVAQFELLIVLNGKCFYCEYWPTLRLIFKGILLPRFRLHHCVIDDALYVLMGETQWYKRHRRILLYTSMSELYARQASKSYIFFFQFGDWPASTRPTIVLQIALR